MSPMLDVLSQRFSIKKYLSWKDLLSNVRSSKKARGPLRGYVTTLCFWTLMDIGLLDPLKEKGSVSPKDFAQQNKLNFSVFFSVCQYLHRLGYLSLNDCEVALTAKGLSFWKDVSSIFHLFYAYEPIFSSLSAQMKGDVTYGREIFRNEDEVARGFSELGNKFIFKIIKSILEEQSLKSMIELGCAEAELSVFLCLEDPKVRCLGVDHSSRRIGQAQKKIEALNLTSRIQLLLADIFEIDRTSYDFSPYETVAAVDLFHGYFLNGEEKLLGLFQKFKKVFKGRYFLISEVCLPSFARMKEIAYPNVEHELFHDLTQQRSFRPGQLEGLFEQAGFAIKKRWPYHEIAGRIYLLLQA